MLNNHLNKDGLQLGKQDLTPDEWRQEAQKLELQGKKEQAKSIRNQIFKQKEVPWKVLKENWLEQLQQEAIEGNNKKSKLLFFEYALMYRDQNRLNALIKSSFLPAKKTTKGVQLY